MSEEVSSTPPIAEPISITPAPVPVKIATPDIIMLQSDKLPIDTMADMVFDDIGGHELISISRSDLINGQNIDYQLIGNLKEINQQFNSMNLVPLPGSSDKYFHSKAIEILDRIPEVGNGLNGEFVYLDQETGDVVIDLVNLAADEQVEVEILSPQTLFNDTMY